MTPDGSATAESLERGARGAPAGGEVSAARGVSRAGADQGLVCARGGRSATSRASGQGRPTSSSTGSRSPSRRLNESEAPFYKWFEDGKLNVSYNCLDRHVEAGKGDKVAFHWRGEEGEEREVTYADLHRDVQRFANALKDRGIGKGDVVGIYLPMVPELVGRDARLRANRRSAQRRLRRLLARRGQGADGVLRREGAGDHRRGAPQGQDGADQAAGRREDRRRQVDRDHLRRPSHGRGLRDAGRPRRLVRRGARGRRRRVRARAARRRAPAVRPLHVGLDGEAQGRPSHHRRLPARRHLHAPLRVRPEAGHRRLLVRGRRRLGHGPQLHRLRAALQRRDQRHVRGRARLSGQGHLVGDRRALRGDDPVHGADRDPRLHEVGSRVPGQARSLLAAPAGHRRRADQPEGMALVPQGDRRRALPDRRHLVADGDRATS